jgi:hypothetical protein
MFQGSFEICRKREGESSSKNIIHSFKHHQNAFELFLLKLEVNSLQINQNK